MRRVNLLPRGQMSYLEVDHLQRYINARVAAHEQPDTFVIWEAQPTYTAGSRTKPEDTPDTTIPIIPMDRGGSVTYHGPGQLVVYPIVSIAPPDDLPHWVRTTEAALIEAVGTLGVEARAIKGRSGVWVGSDPDKKLCAIGMKFREHTSMHGLALNVTTDLTGFSHIIPCGLADAGVTSLTELGVNAPMSEVATLVVDYLEAAYAPLAARTSTKTNASEAEIEDLLHRSAEEYRNAPWPPVAAAHHSHR